LPAETREGLGSRAPAARHPPRGRARNPVLVSADPLRYLGVMVTGLAIATPGNALLPDEDSDLRAEAGKFFANPDEWLNTPNSNFGGRTPNDLVRDGQAESVRNLLRSLKYIGVS
jgi:Protein of unknown function (DUF2384)